MISKILKNKYLPYIVAVVILTVYFIFFRKSKSEKTTELTDDIISNPLVLTGDIVISIPPGRTPYELALDRSQSAIYVLRGNKIFRITTSGKKDVTNTIIGRAVTQRCKSKGCTVNENKRVVNGKQIGVIDDDLTSFLKEAYKADKDKSIDDDLASF